MKLVIELDNEKFIKDDLLLYNGKEFVGYNKDTIIAELVKKVDDLQTQVETLKNNVNDKLREYHNILNTLYKEDK